MALASGARWSAHGTGTPVTVIVHGLGATEGEARIPASGLRGTRVVITLPGHGRASDAPAGYWTYSRIAEDVLGIADEVEATRAVGVSLGAGALTRIAASHPTRFERLALLLPAALDQPRDPAGTEVFARLAAAATTAATDGGAQLRKLIAEDVPAGADVGDYVERRAAVLTRLEDALRSVPHQNPLEHAGALAEVAARVLVIGATEDPLHPAAVARSTAEAFPAARLELLPSAAPMVTHRGELRGVLTEFLNDRG